jgi:hypothetical protein
VEDGQSCPSPRENASEAAIFWTIPWRMDNPVRPPDRPPPRPRFLARISHLWPSEARTDSNRIKQTEQRNRASVSQFSPLPPVQSVFESQACMYCPRRGVRGARPPRTLSAAPGRPSAAPRTLSAPCFLPSAALRTPSAALRTLSAAPAHTFGSPAYVVSSAARAVRSPAHVVGSPACVVRRPTDVVSRPADVVSGSLSLSVNHFHCR